MATDKIFRSVNTDYVFWHKVEKKLAFEIV